MPKSDEGTSPEEREQTSGETEAQEASPSTESAATEEESLTDEQMARARALLKLEQEKNVDFNALLPEYTRARQYAKELEAETAGWRQTFQQMHQQQQRQADPITSLSAQIVEAETAFDHEKAERLRMELVREQSRRIAQETFQTMHQQQTAQNTEAALMEELRAHGLTQKEANELAAKAASNPKALAYLILAAKDERLVEEHALRNRTERERRAQEAGRHTSLAGRAGGGRMVPGADREEQREPLRVPASIYFAFPEKVARKKFGEDAIVISGA